MGVESFDESSTSPFKSIGQAGGSWKSNNSRWAHLVQRVDKIAHADGRRTLSFGRLRCLFADAHDHRSSTQALHVRARHLGGVAGQRPGERVHAHIGGAPEGPGVQGEHRADVRVARELQSDVVLQPPRPEQRLVQRVDVVARGQDDDAVLAVVGVGLVLGEDAVQFVEKGGQHAGLEVARAPAVSGRVVESAGGMRVAASDSKWAR